MCIQNVSVAILSLLLISIDSFAQKGLRLRVRMAKNNYCDTLEYTLELNDL